MYTEFITFIPFVSKKVAVIKYKVFQNFQQVMLMIQSININNLKNTMAGKTLLRTQ